MVFGLIAILAVGCGSTPKTPVAPTTPTASAAPAADPTLSSDPLDQASLAFVGGHSRSEIKLTMDEVLTVYGLELSDENYSRAGSVLVGLRKAAIEQGCLEEDCSEMAILET